MKYIKLYVLGLGVTLSLVLASILGSNVGAASEWDQTIRVAEDLKITNVQQGSNDFYCSELDEYLYNDKYWAYIIDNNGLPGGLEDAWNNAPSNATYMVLNNPQGIQVFLFYGDPVFESFTEPNGTKTFRPTVDVQAYEAKIRYQSACPMIVDDFIPFGRPSAYNPLITSYYGGNIAQGGSSLDTVYVIGNRLSDPAYKYLYYDVWVYNGTINYPAGYEGLEPPRLPDSEGSQFGAKPNITWEYDNLNVKFRSDELKNSNVTLRDDYQIYWHFSNITFDGHQDPEDVYTYSGCTPVEYLNNHDVPVLGEYAIQAYYADSACNILSKDEEGRTLISNELVLDLDGGSASGSTDINEEEFTQAQHIQMAFKNAIKLDAGLEVLLVAPLEVVYNVASWQGECQPITLPIMGSNQPIPCMKTIIANALPELVILITLFINGIIAYLLVINVVRQIKQTFDPDYNKIEVFTL